MAELDDDNRSADARPGEDLVDVMRRLAALRDRDQLTEREFELAKAKAAEESCRDRGP